MQVLHGVNQGATSQVQTTSTTTTDVKTVTPPPGARGCLLTVETTSARITLNGVDPAANNGFVLAKDQTPWYLPAAVTIKFTSTAAANCVLNTSWLF